MPWQRSLGSQRLLVSGFGKWGGGVYDLTSGRPVALDDLPTSGLAVGGGRVWRVLRAPGEQTASCELLAYDERGVVGYRRLDVIRDPHDLCWHDGAVHVTSSWDGTVWRVDDGGAPRPVWQGGAIPDSWHVNSLVVVDGRLHVCAFGRFDGHKTWKAAHDAQGRRAATGFVHDIARGEDVLRGLGHPHAPRWANGRWYICESTRGALTELAPDGRVLRRVGIQRFSRGLAILGRWALVGGNAHRDTDDDRAEIVIVDLRSFTVADRIAMPCLEVYDIVAAPPELVEGLALGFGGNPARAVEQHRGTSRDAVQQPAPEGARVQLVTPAVSAQLATPGTTLDPTVAARCAVRAKLPGRLVAGEWRMLTVAVENRSNLALASVPPQPVRVGARWFGPGGRSHRADSDPRDDDVTRNPTTPLPRLLRPGDRTEVEVILAAPVQPGRYQVRVALYQPQLGWFGVRAQGAVVVDPADVTPTSDVPTDAEPVDAITTA